MRKGKSALPAEINFMVASEVVLGLNILDSNFRFCNLASALCFNLLRLFELDVENGNSRTFDTLHHMTTILRPKD
jgi:hypothetical protein